MGIDDFAFKKRFTYGTLFFDLQTHKPVDILNIRQPSEVTEWLQQYPTIKLITRDGSKKYAAAVKKASPAILQVADRWHLLHQLFEALKKTVFTILPAKWTPPSPCESTSQNDEVNLKLRKHERLRVRNEEKRWSRIREIQFLFQKGYSKVAIQRKLNISRGTVYADLRQTERPNHQRASPFDQFRLPSDRIGYQGSLSTLNALVAT